MDTLSNTTSEILVSLFYLDRNTKSVRHSACEMERRSGGMHFLHRFIIPSTEADGPCAGCSNLGS